jgi:hypothetical protein
LNQCETSPQRPFNPIASSIFTRIAIDGIDGTTGLLQLGAAALSDAELLNTRLRTENSAGWARADQELNQPPQVAFLPLAPEIVLNS